MIRTIALSALVLAACHHAKKGGTPDGSVAMDGSVLEPADMAEGPDLGSFATAQHGTLPTFMSLGGPVIAAPHLVTITFSDYQGDDAALATYGDWLVGPSWLPVVGQEYGVGAGTHTHVHLTTKSPATTDYASAATLLEQLIGSNKVPAETPGTMYMMIFSEGTDISDAPGGCASNYAPGYHLETQDNQQLVYGVIGSCTAGGDRQTDYTLSHEVIEAATDPYPNAMPGWQWPASSPWSYIGGELADMCTQPIELMNGNTPVLASRVWSVEHAKLTGDPCLPARSDAFFWTTSASMELVGMPGMDVNVPLTAWSTLPGPNWSVQAASNADDIAGDPVVTAVDKTFVGNGDTVTLTVTVPASAQPGEDLGVLVYSVSATADLDYMTWPITIHVN